VPSREGLEVARTRIRDYLGWEEVRSQLKDQEVDLIRGETLAANLETAKKKVPEAVRQAYNIVVAVSEGNEDQAFNLTRDPARPLDPDDLASAARRCGPDEHDDGGRAARGRRAGRHRTGMARPRRLARPLAGAGGLGGRRAGLLLGREGRQGRPAGVRRA